MILSEERAGSSSENNTLAHCLLSHGNLVLLIIKCFGKKKNKTHPQQPIRVFGLCESLAGELTCWDPPAAHIARAKCDLSG